MFHCCCCHCWQWQPLTFLIFLHAANTPVWAYTPINNCMRLSANFFGEFLCDYHHCWPCHLVNFVIVHHYCQKIDELDNSLWFLMLPMHHLGFETLISSLNQCFSQRRCLGNNLGQPPNTGQGRPLPQQDLLT